MVAGEVVELGRDDSIITIGELPKAEGTWVGKRALSIEGKPGFELSYSRSRSYPVGSAPAWSCSTRRSSGYSDRSSRLVATDRCF
jgi:hypothetical protein